MTMAFTRSTRSLLIKVCGMRDPQNIAEVGALRPDFMGFIFHPSSPRYIGELPRQLALPSTVSKVGVFVNAASKDVVAIAQHNRLDVVQLHGTETPYQCELLQNCGFGVFKAFSIDKGTDFGAMVAYQDVCDAFLFDTKGKLPGGNGVKFDWDILAQYHGSTPFFLSGGIQLGDAAAILDLQHPSLLGLDLNSGFESQPGLKNAPLLQQFLQQIQQ
jgi:phosphoribosylanthranilate isomerase